MDAGALDPGLVARIGAAHRRRRRKWALVFVAAAVILAALLPLPSSSTAADLAKVVVFSFAVLALLAAPIGWFSAGADLRALRRLARGEGLLARWTLSAADWNHFVEWDRQLGARDPRRANALRAAPAEAPVEIVLGDRAVLVGDALLRVPESRTVTVTSIEYRPGPIGVFELIGITPHKHGVTPWAFRLPVAPVADADARRVDAAWRERLRPTPTRVQELIRGIVLTLLGGALAGAMLWIGWWTLGTIYWPDPAGSRFTGTGKDIVFMAAVFGLVFSFGLFILINGVYCIVHRQRHKGMLRIALMLGQAFFTLPSLMWLLD
jgi:hypothetical protein